LIVANSRLESSNGAIKRAPTIAATAASEAPYPKIAVREVRRLIVFIRSIPFLPIYSPVNAIERPSKEAIFKRQKSVKKSIIGD
jgi:hypothetical protein